MGLLAVFLDKIKNFGPLSFVRMSRAGVTLELLYQLAAEPVLVAAPKTARRIIRSGFSRLSLRAVVALTPPI